MNILEEIKRSKEAEVRSRRLEMPVERLVQTEGYRKERRSLKKVLDDATGPAIIAEFKRKAPSAGPLREGAAVDEIVTGYAGAGACALSVLTDGSRFGGSLADLGEAVRLTDVPVLRKDFVIDEYQLVESRAHGADVILLIASMLGPERVRQLAAKAREIGLEVLLELHGEDELDHLCEETDLVGVNNRNLKDFSVDTGTSVRLGGMIPGEFTRVSESGISDPAVILKLHGLGYRGFLIGTHFMASTDPVKACADMVEAVRSKKHII